MCALWVDVVCVMGQCGTHLVFPDDGGGDGVGDGAPVATAEGPCPLHEGSTGATPRQP